MKILITGGAGFIGSEILNQLTSCDHEITVLDSLAQQIHGVDPERNSFLYSRIKGKCNFIKGDVRDYQTVEKAITGCDVIIHLAAETGTGQSMYEINQYNSVNIMGTSNLFQAILNHKQHLSKFILASSRAVYGEGKYQCEKCGIVYPTGRDESRMKQGDFNMYCPHCGREVKIVPTDENSLIQTKSLYAFTKRSQEMLVETMCNAMEIPYTIFRFQNVYGVGQSLKNPYTGILSIFSSLMLENKPVNIFEDGKESRDFINVKDIAAGVIASIENPQSDSQVFNLGSGIETTVIEIAEMMKKYYNSRSDIRISGDFRKGDIARNYADVGKARRLLNFEPRITLENGMKDFSQWVQTQIFDNSGYDKSLKELKDNGMYYEKDGTI